MDSIQQIIEINVKEESSLPEILDELVQDVKGLDRSTLTHLAAERLRALAEKGAIEFYHYGEKNTFVDVSMESALAAMTRQSAWEYHQLNEDLHVCPA